ncbi:hypothetical protein F4818DRAFT_171323 [Hypoxylon cercidicola]|nr:hypothetical protein F4818DRAFT_171323 [Hypoxylon cercidicola]
MDGWDIAAAVIQFIEFTTGLIAKGVSIYSSLDGRTVEHRELEETTRSLTECHREIQQSIQFKIHKRELTAAEREQERIGHACQKTAEELLEVISRLGTRGPITKRKFFRQALRAASMKARCTLALNLLLTRLGLPFR